MMSKEFSVLVDFYDNSGNIWTVNQLFDKILELEQENSKLNKEGDLYVKYSNFS